MYKLTIDEKAELEGITYDGETFFYPVQDINNAWFIGWLEVNNCTHSTGIEWIHSLSYVEYIEKPRVL